MSAHLRIGEELLGYRLAELVARGGMGVVYRAYDSRLKRSVALKLVAPELFEDEHFRQRFLAETELAASLEHPNVVPIYDAGEVDGQLYLAMRYVEGCDLKALLGQEHLLEPDRAIAICDQIAAALDAAHVRGLVHRDVKPSNVLLDAHEHVYLADFGLSRRLDEPGLPVGPGLSLGTPAYAAPEQIQGREDVDGRADVYSLGCVLYECLSGQVPFRRNSELATLFAHLEEEPPVLPGLENVISTALAKDPAERYAMCAKLVDAARAALGLDEPLDRSDRPRTPPVIESPPTSYVRSGDANIAYQVLGEGPVDVVYAPGMAHHVELVWEVPPQARFLRRLASDWRLLLFDKRGTGLSDRVVGAPTLETRMDDISAVMDACGSERAVLLGAGDAGPLCTLFAATYPERIIALVLMNTTPCFVRTTDLPWLPPRREVERGFEELTRRWGDRERTDEVLRSSMPGATDDERAAFGRVFRLSLSPGSVAQYLRMTIDTDVRGVLPSIRVPTLVFHRTGLASPDIRCGRYMAEHIRGSRLIELDGPDYPPGIGNQDQIFAELDAFITTAAEGGRMAAEPERVLATVLFTDIVDATARAAALGDSEWRMTVEKHHELVRRQLSRFRGTEVDTAGDGFFATFDGPARAIQCACTIRQAVRELGLEVRAGLHSGECEFVDGKVGGIAVHIGARVVSQAAPDEVLVSSTVKELVAGSGIDFDDRGLHELKGVPGAWRLFAVANAR